MFYKMKLIWVKKGIRIVGCFFNGKRRSYIKELECDDGYVVRNVEEIADEIIFSYKGFFMEEVME